MQCKHHRGPQQTRTPLMALPSSSPTLLPVIHVKVRYCCLGSSSFISAVKASFLPRDHGHRHASVPHALAPAAPVAVSVDAHLPHGPRGQAGRWPSLLMHEAHTACKQLSPCLDGDVVRGGVQVII